MEVDYEKKQESGFMTESTKDNWVQIPNELFVAVVQLDKSLIKKLVKEYDINMRLTQARIPFWSILMSTPGQNLDTDAKKKNYYEVL